jgi:hypothetical protein
VFHAPGRFIASFRDMEDIKTDSSKKKKKKKERKKKVSHFAVSISPYVRSLKMILEKF